MSKTKCFIQDYETLNVDWGIKQKIPEMNYWTIIDTPQKYKCSCGWQGVKGEMILLNDTLIVGCPKCNNNEKS